VANIEDVYRKLIDLNRELISLTTIGVVGQATEIKQDAQIVEAQNIITEIQGLLTEVQAPTALANQDKQDEVIAGLDAVKVAQEDSTEVLRSLNTNSSVDILKFMAEQQVQTNNLLKLILS
jgi:predicted Mrr-cat superfamily restriction endonuclease